MDSEVIHPPPPPVIFVTPQEPRGYPKTMERVNSEGIRRVDLRLALRTRRMVAEARRVDTCLLCRRHKVNEAGLCDVCYSTLEGDELELAVAWMRGVGP